MYPADSYAVATEALREYEAKTYDELRLLVGRPPTTSAVQHGGVEYGVSMLVEWKDKEGGEVRVTATVETQSSWRLERKQESFVVGSPAAATGGEPRIWHDFQNCDEDGRLRLHIQGTIADLAKHGIELREGLRLRFYDEDDDSSGKRDDLTATGVVERNSGNGTWVARLDKNGVRHESDLERD